jgi:hypothetical protein
VRKNTKWRISAVVFEKFKKILVVLKSPTHIGFICVKNGSKISHLGTFKLFLKLLVAICRYISSKLLRELVELEVKGHNSTPMGPFHCLKVHKIENFFDSDFGICIISLLVMSKY